MIIAVGTKNMAKTKAVEEIVKKYDIQCEMIFENVDSGVSAQPFTNEETRQGAINRAKRVLEQTNADWGFGLEGGVQIIDGIMYCVNWGSLALKNGNVYCAQGASFELPHTIAKKLLAGEELGPVMNEYTNSKNIRHHEGAIGIFTNGFINREEMFEHIVTLLIGQVYYYEKLENDNNNQLV